MDPEKARPPSEILYASFLLDPEKASPPSETQSDVFPSEVKEEQSPLKKPRVEEEHKHQKVPEDDRADVDDDEDDDDDDLCFGRRFTDAERARYKQQVEESEGFDIDYVRGVGENGMIAPIVYFKKSALWYNNSRLWAILAIEKYNKDKNKNYEFDDVEKVNAQGTGWFTCWVTFKAKDMEDPDPRAEPETFQAKVYAGFTEVEVVFCRPKKVP